METLIQEILNYLMSSPYASYSALAVGVFYVISHIIALLPAKVVSKIPTWLMKLINAISANYKNTKNASGK